MKSTIFYPFLLIGIFLVAACGGAEKPSKDGEETIDIAKLLEGDWETIEFKRNGNSQDRTFFVKYSSDGTFTSDIPNKNQELPFSDGISSSLTGHSISFESIPDTFHIDEISDTSLILSTKIRNFPFEFIFVKK